MDKRHCLDCGEVLQGRIDKKYCSDQCRNNYNNKLAASVNNYVRNVNYVLRKNRRILEELAPAGKATVHRRKLTDRGFDFQHITGLYTTRKGVTYHYCYEYGYLPLSNELYLVIRRKEEKESI